MSVHELYLVPHSEQQAQNYEPQECASRLGISMHGHGPVTLLDIGSGVYAKFARAFVKANPGSSAIVVDPHFTSSNKRKQKLSSNIATDLDKQYGPHPVAIGGHVENMDFIHDNSVDLITANWSVPHYLPTEVNAERAFSEIIRVLKPGGKAILVPIFDEDREMYQEAFTWLSKHKGIKLLSEPYIGKTAARLIIHKL